MSTDFKTYPGSIIDGVYVFPPVVTKTSRGKESRWVIKVRAIKDAAYIPIIADHLENRALSVPLSGQSSITAEIKVDSGIGETIRKSEPTIVTKGKNIGRANATNVICQAIRDAFGQWTKQSRKTPTQAHVTPFHPPMLAKPLSTLDWASGVFVSRKYDGLRAVTTLFLACDATQPQLNETSSREDVVAAYDKCESRPVTYSRDRIEYPTRPNILAIIEPVLRHYWSQGIMLYIDGEYYKHTLQLQEISGMMRGSDPPVADMGYMVYDCFVANEPALTFVERLAMLTDIFAMIPDNPTVAMVEHTRVVSKAAADALYAQFIAEKYEGAMIRLNTPYVYSYNSHHTSNLLKMKPRHDGEYTIVGWTTGERGKAAKSLMIICTTDDGKQFTVTPALPIAVREELAAKMPTVFDTEYKGKKIIVNFDDWSKDGKPQRASTELKFRQYA